MAMYKQKAQLKTVSEAICPVKQTIEIIGKKWTLLAIYRLSKGEMRFTELKSSLSGIPAKTLSATLKYLIKNGIVNRTIVDSSPPAVLYSLTPKGKELREIFEALNCWGEKWLMK